MQPGDVFVGGRLTHRMVASRSPNTAVLSAAGTSVDPATGRRVDDFNSPRMPLTTSRLSPGIGNTPAQNFASQAQRMAVMLRNRLGGNIGATYVPSPANGGRYRFRGTIRRPTFGWRRICP